jgi:hypothetical protein
MVGKRGLQGRPSIGGMRAGAISMPFSSCPRSRCAKLERAHAQVTTNTSNLLDRKVRHAEFHSGFGWHRACITLVQLNLAPSPASCTPRRGPHRLVNELIACYLVCESKLAALSLTPACRMGEGRSFARSLTSASASKPRAPSHSTNCGQLGGNSSAVSSSATHGASCPAGT